MVPQSEQKADSPSRRRKKAPDYTSEARELGYYPLIRFDPLTKIAFDRFIGEWAFAFMAKHLRDPSEVYPVWAARFCTAVKAIGIDECSSKADVHAFVTSHAAYREARRAHIQFHWWTFHHRRHLALAIPSLPESMQSTAFKRLSIIEEESARRVSLRKEIKAAVAEGRELPFMRRKKKKVAEASNGIKKEGKASQGQKPSTKHAQTATKKPAETPKTQPQLPQRKGTKTQSKKRPSQPVIVVRRRIFDDL